jgi:hypothetical protein
MTPPPRHLAAQLRIDPIDCRAHGLCAELFPEVIDLDEWGYPCSPTQTSRRDCSPRPGKPPPRARPSPCDSPHDSPAATPTRMAANTSAGRRH